LAGIHSLNWSTSVTTAAQRRAGSATSPARTRYRQPKLSVSSGDSSSRRVRENGKEQGRQKHTFQSLIHSWEEQTAWASCWYYTVWCFTTNNRLQTGFGITANTTTKYFTKNYSNIIFTSPSCSSKPGRPASCFPMITLTKTKLAKLRGLSPRANYTDRATAACRRS
jgi:hypothetical protein